VAADALYYHLRKLVRAGLLISAGTRAATRRQRSSSARRRGRCAWFTISAMHARRPPCAERPGRCFGLRAGTSIGGLAWLAPVEGSLRGAGLGAFLALHALPGGAVPALAFAIVVARFARARGSPVGRGALRTASLGFAFTAAVLLGVAVS
jgi:hypothetical protein